MTDRYDVIIVGSGAGGGTLAHTLAPSGRKILLLERGDFLPRELTNWDSTAVFVDGRYISPDTWYDSDGKPFQPQVHYFVGGATKMYGAALYRLRPADFGEITFSDGHLAGLAAGLRRPRALLHPGPNGCTRCTAITARTRPRARSPSSIRGRPCRTSRGSSSSPTTSPRPDTTRSTRRAGSCSTRTTGAASDCIRCAWVDGSPCLVHAKCDAEVIAVRPLLGPAERHPARRRRGEPASDRSVRAASSPRSW